MARVNSINSRAKIQQEEAERLGAQHRILNIVFDGRLIFPPVSSLQKVLDLGYGAANWAVEVAHKHPQSEVWMELVFVTRP
jgi:hypothetical protein